MADSSSDRIVVSCSCGAKLRVAATSVGKKAKCPKCGEVISITAPASTQPQAKQPAATPSPLDDDAGGLLDDLAMHEQSAEASDSPCPGCGASMQPGARVCVECGFDAKKGVAQKSALLPSEPTEDEAAKQLAKRAGTFALGCTLSGVGASLGAGIWCLVAIKANYEIGWIAWGVGILAGVGMSFGYRQKTQTAGVVAAGIALSGVILAKALVFVIVIYAVVLGHTSDPDLRRQHVVWQTTNEILVERGIDPENPTDEEWESAWNEAETKMAVHSDEEIERLWQEYQDADALFAEEESLAQEQALDENQGSPADEEDIPVGEMLTLFFTTMFGLFDLLFIFLAVSSAYKIASGGSEST